MPSTRIPISTIESWTPAIDAKSVENGSLFVLAGRNYLFDAKGPKAGFGSTLVSNASIDESLEHVESIKIAGRTVVLTGNGAFERRSLVRYDDVGIYSGSEEEWFRLASWETQDEYDIGSFGWTAAYVGFGAFLNHPGYGLFRLLGDTLEPFEQVGVDERVLAIAESAGRLILITTTLTQYSNADDAKDMSPDLGGAGFQITAQRVPGKPLALTSFQGGFIIWTTAGVLAAEFIGGDTVFRFDRVITEQFMISTKAWEPLASGDIVVMTKQGLFLSSAANGLSAYDDVFNEYLRDLMSNSDDYFFRLTYIKEDDLLYVQMADSTIYFNKTYVYHQASKKWGEFNEPHRGIIRFGAESGEYGYADLEGFVHHFDGSSFRESQDGILTGLDSYVSLGYLRPASGAEYADVEFETQEIVISASKSSTKRYPIIEEDWNGPDSFVSYNIGFYRFDTNWSEFGVDFYDIDYNIPAPAEDWSLPTLPDDNWNNVVAGQRDFDWSEPVPGQPDADWSLTPDGGVDTTYIEDWGYVLEVDIEEDWNGITATYNVVDYQLEMHSDIDGFESDLVTTPVRAIQRIESDIWTLFSHGHNQRLLVAAIQPWEKFHVTSLAFSVTYAGRII